MQRAAERAEGRYAYLGPLYRQVKQAAWDALKTACEAPGVEFSESELQVRLPNGARVQLFGADNYQALRGMHLDGIVLDEYADINPDAWTEVIRPAIAAREGFAVFIGTPRGRNHFYRLYETARQDPAWFTALYRHGDSGVIGTQTGEAAQREVELARRQMTEDHFAQEYECSFEAAIQGAYYAREIETARLGGRITRLTWEPTLPVETWWDLGFTDATAVIFAQRVGRELHVLDYLEGHSEGLAYYAKALKERPYVYGRHYLPHDAGYHQQASAGVTLEEQLKALGITPTRVLPKSDVLAGINEARLVFPRVWFDSVACALLLDALAAYRAKWDDTKKTLMREPQHDWASHGADAFRLLAVSLKDFKPAVTPVTPKASVLGFSPYGYAVRSSRPARATKTTDWRLFR